MGSGGRGPAQLEASPCGHISRFGISFFSPNCWKVATCIFNTQKRWFSFFFFVLFLTLKTTPSPGEVITSYFVSAYSYLSSRLGALMDRCVLGRWLVGRLYRCTHIYLQHKTCVHVYRRNKSCRFVSPKLLSGCLLWMEIPPGDSKKVPPASIVTPSRYLSGAIIYRYTKSHKEFKKKQTK